MKISTAIFFTVVVLAIIALVALAGALLVLLAYGVGLLINLVMHLEPFQATVISLAGIVLAGWFVWQVLSELIPSPTRQPEYEDEADFDYEEDDEDNDNVYEEEPIVVREYPGVPLWRQPLKQVDFSNARPDDRCPCGSGRKYKNCHGTGAKHGK
jgi:hypothetical protein